jgi:hypothetical protein
MKYLLLILFVFFASIGFSQDFAADIKNAKASYASGKLEDAHFALLQAKQEVDLIIGKEVLKLLPEKMDNFTVNSKDDNVTSNVGFIGTTIHRSYGTEQKVDISIIGNSPLVSTISAFLNTPLLGGMMSNGKNKIIKVQGYKGQLTKDDNSDGQTNYTIQIPLGNSLMTITGKNVTDTQMMAWANSLPMQQIAKLAQ